jgi:ABC transport system ATP-binding/permease protein
VTDTAYGMFGDGRLVHLPGGIDEYLARAGNPAAPPGELLTTGGKAPAATSGMSAAELRAARKDLSRLERQVAKLDERILKINESLAVHGSDYDKIMELDAQLKAVQEERGQVEEAWLELAERVPES